MTSWYENDEFWRENYLVMFSDEAFRRAVDDLDHLLSLTGLQPRRVLDLCCGAGRYLIPLAQRCERHGRGPVAFSARESARERPGSWCFRRARVFGHAALHPSECL